ncbi:MAG: hypothetical protein AAB546_04920 [Patescibacteria group bacterium]
MSVTTFPGGERSWFRLVSVPDGTDLTEYASDAVTKWRLNHHYKKIKEAIGKRGVSIPHQNAEALKSLEYGEEMSMEQMELVFDLTSGIHRKITGRSVILDYRNSFLSNIDRSYPPAFVEQFSKIFDQFVNSGAEWKIPSSTEVSDRIPTYTLDDLVGDWNDLAEKFLKPSIEAVDFVVSNKNGRGY